MESKRNFRARQVDQVDPGFWITPRNQPPGGAQCFQEIRLFSTFDSLRKPRSPTVKSAYLDETNTQAHNQRLQICQIDFVKFSKLENRTIKPGQ